MNHNSGHTRARMQAISLSLSASPPATTAALIPRRSMERALLPLLRLLPPPPPAQLPPLLQGRPVCRKLHWSGIRLSSLIEFAVHVHSDTSFPSYSRGRFQASYLRTLCWNNYDYTIICSHLPTFCWKWLLSTLDNGALL